MMIDASVIYSPTQLIFAPVHALKVVLGCLEEVPRGKEMYGDCRYDSAKFTFGVNVLCS